MSFISEDTVSASMDMDMGDIKGDVVVVGGGGGWVVCDRVWAVAGWPWERSGGRC